VAGFARTVRALAVGLWTVPVLAARRDLAAGVGETDGVRRGRRADRLGGVGGLPPRAGGTAAPRPPAGRGAARSSRPGTNRPIMGWVVLAAGWPPRFIWPLSRAASRW